MFTKTFNFPQKYKKSEFTIIQGIIGILKNSNMEIYKLKNIDGLHA